jgi:outer membrane protein OmpA-like peptidoglycan-associated protein
MKTISRLTVAGVLSLVILSAAQNLPAQNAPAEASAADRSAWFVGLGGGYIKYEGDEATENGGFVLLHLGYDLTPRWTLRGEVSFFPELKSNAVYNTDVPTPRPGLHGASTWAAGVAGDVLFHFVGESDRILDPYLIGGIGLLYYDKVREWRSQTDIPVRAGLGLACNFTPSWSVNLDLMGQMTLDKQEFNFIPSAGISWRPGGGRAAAVVAPAPEPEDIQKFELIMNFAEGQWQISPEYFMELDAIAKIIQQHAGAKVLIEGHVDRQPKMSEKDARQLTERRAEALRDYFTQKHPIPRNRITTVGYGYSRPKASAEPGKANPENRRMVIHIRAAPTAQ